MQKTLLSVLVLLLLLSSCQRKSIDEPMAIDPNNLLIDSLIIHTSISPTLLNISSDREPPHAAVVVKVFNAHGTPLAGQNVLFQQYQMSAAGVRQATQRGFFEGNRLSVTKATDANGCVTVDYSVADGNTLQTAADTTIYIYAFLVIPNRTDIYDAVPLQVHVH